MTEEAALIRAKFKARDRLAQLSNSALREACELADDVMLVFMSEGCMKEAEMFQTLLIDLVMEEERRGV